MKQYLVAILALFFLIGCAGDQPTDRRSLLPGYIGQAGEVLVIMEPSYWNSAAGEVVREVLSSQAGILPQYEPMFTISQYPPDAFDRLLRPHRNILFIEIKDNIHYKEPKVQILHEKYAKGQILVNCFAQTEEAFISKFSNVASTVLEKINQAEIRRQKQYNSTFGTKTLDKLLKEKYKVDLAVYPQGDIRTQLNHFAWIHKVTARPKDGRMHDVQQGIIIYDYPYVDDSTFTKKFLLAKRDSMLRKYMPGPKEGSYMTTEYYYEPAYKEVNFNGEYAVEMRGLYKMENAFMGGPFVSLTTYDEARGRIVTVEGFVFAPKFDKREYLREVEAVVKSLSFVPDSTQQQNEDQHK
jgi:hypothetical protein